MINFKSRKATDKIIILIKDTAFMDYDSYFKHCRCQGELDIGVHYFMDTNGTVHAARDKDAVAGWQYEDNDTSLFILVQSNNKKMNSCQRCALPLLLDNLKKIYKNVEVIERVD